MFWKRAAQMQQRPSQYEPAPREERQVFDGELGDNADRCIAGADWAFGTDGGRSPVVRTR